MRNAIGPWTQFVRGALGDTAFNQAAERIGDVSASTVGNWAKGENFNQPRAELVIAFARAFGKPVPDALVAAGYGGPDDYDGTILTKPDMGELSTAELLDEARRRIASIDPKDERAALARDVESPASEARRRKAAAVTERIPRTADARKRRQD